MYHSCMFCSSIFEGRGDSQMCVNNKVVSTNCEGPAGQGMTELDVQRSASVKKCEEVFAKYSIPCD